MVGVEWALSLRRVATRFLKVFELDFCKKGFDR